MSRSESSGITAHPATHDRWDDLVEVFGPRGAYEGCWCMYWRIKRKEMGRLGVKGRRAAMEDLTHRDPSPGLLFYDDDKPFGWCSLGPREEFGVLGRSPLLKPVDDKPTWSIICFFLKEEYRGEGHFRTMVELALEYARGQGARRIEAYPREQHTSGTWAYMGISDVYRSMGFEEIACRKPGRPVLRLEFD